MYPGFGVSLLSDLVRLVKQAAIDAVGQTKPVQLLFGKVVGVTPLQVQISQKLILSAQDLILTSAVQEHGVEMTVNHTTGSAEGHSHSYKGKQEFLIHNDLAAGDVLILLQMQGGQKFLVIDKVVK